MLNDPIQVIILLITGVVALIMGIILLYNYVKHKNLYHLLWSISFLVLFVAGALIILIDFTILNEPLIRIVAVLIPACLAIGLIYAVWQEKNYWWYYGIYILVFLVILVLVEYVPGFENFRSYSIMALHVPSGLILVLVPAYTAYTNQTEYTSLFYSAGGLAISIGGILLAFLKLGSPILDQNQIFAVLPTLLLIVGVLFVLGIILPEKWKVELPFAK